MSTQYSYQLS